jgi:DNA-binding CsgD family transcriptional regulator
MTGLDTAEAWSECVQTWDGIGDPYTAAYAHWRQAEAVLGAGGRRTDAEALLRGAAEVALGLGGDPLLREIEDLARRARLELRHPEVRKAEPAESGSAVQDELRRLGLSIREIEVLALVEEGLTDRDIGLRLFITEKSAGHHVSHILAKLGVSRRVEAAAIAHRLNLVGAGIASEEKRTRTAGSS